MIRVTLELTPRELGVLEAAVGAQCRYFRNGLDRAKTDEAVTRWASWCVVGKKLADKVQAGKGAS